MCKNAFSMTLLTNNSLELLFQGIMEYHIAKPCLGVGDRQQGSQLTPGLAYGSGLSGAVTAFGLIDQGSQFFGQLTMAQLRFVCGKLHGYGEKSLIIAFHV
jgi:hypothetical protein